MATINTFTSKLYNTKLYNTLIEHASHVARASLTVPPLLAARSGSFLFLYIVSELENKKAAVTSEDRGGISSAAPPRLPPRSVEVEGV